MKSPALITVAASVLLCSCASIIGKSDYPLNIASTPSTAHFTIKDKSGTVIHAGTTPEVVTLKSSAGYFTAARYDITFEKDGFTPKTYSVTAGLDGWYFGNILFGGLIGMLIVDPLTGAMYKLPKGVDVPLDAKPQASIDRSLRIIALDEVPASLRSALVRLN